MVQRYTQQDRGSKGGWASNLGSGRAETGRPFSGTIFYSNEAFLCSYSRGVANDQWTAYLPEESKLSRAEATDRETGGPMLSVTGINRFYYLRDLRICDASIAGCYPSYVNNSTVSRLTGDWCLSSCPVTVV